MANLAASQGLSAQASPLASRLLRVANILGDESKNIPPMIPVSRSYWYEGVKSGKFPKGIKLSPRVTVWKESDILALTQGE